MHAHTFIKMLTALKVVILQYILWQNWFNTFKKATYMQHILQNYTLKKKKQKQHLHCIDKIIMHVMKLGTKSKSYTFATLLLHVFKSTEKSCLLG